MPLPGHLLGPGLGAGGRPDVDDRVLSRVQRRVMGGTRQHACALRFLRGWLPLICAAVLHLHLPLRDGIRTARTCSRGRSHAADERQNCRLRRTRQPGRSVQPCRCDGAHSKLTQTTLSAEAPRCPLARHAPAAGGDGATATDSVCGGTMCRSPHAHVYVASLAYRAHTGGC